MRLKKSKLRKKIDNVYSRYWRDRAEHMFMRQFRELPCEICGRTEGTVGHHIIPKSVCGSLRLEIGNIIVLCPLHHRFSREIAPHSFNYLAIIEFVDWMKKNKPDQWQWCNDRKHDVLKIDYKEAYYRLAKGT